MTWFTLMALCGMLFGGAGFVLGIAQLTCEHALSSRTQRLTTFALAVCAGWTGLDCWDALSGVVQDVDNKAIAFSIALTLSWGYRRIRGIESTAKPAAQAVSL